MLIISLPNIPLYLVIGIATSIIGALPFGLVNLSLLQSAVNNGIRSTLPISAGASVVEIGYRIMGIFAGKLIWEYTQNNFWFHLISASILFISGVVFFVRKQRFDFNHNPTFGGFTYGALLNLISLQVLTYWIIAGSILSSVGFLPHALATIAVFLVGIGLGKMGTLWAYAYFGEEIIGKSARISRNINRLMGIILTTLAGIVVVKGIIEIGKTAQNNFIFMKNARQTRYPQKYIRKHFRIFFHLRKMLLTACLTIVSPVYLFSQACCSGGVPLGGSLGLGSAESRSIQFLLTYDYNLLNDLIDGTELLQDDTRRRTTHAVMLEVNYGLSSRFSLAALVPFIQQERNIKGFEQGREFTSTRGLGDVVLLLKYRMLNPATTPGTEWVLGAGPKLPTAHTRHTNNNGLLLPADMQPGSGSLDGILWSFFQHDQIFYPALSFISVATYRYSGANNSYNQSQSYRFGNEFQFNLGMNYHFFLNRPIDVFSYLRYRQQGEDHIDGSVFPGSGGQWLYWVPGLAVNFMPDISVRLSAAVPVYRKLKGAQLTTTYRFTIALSYAINPKQPMVVVPTDNPL